MRHSATDLLKARDSYVRVCQARWYFKPQFQTFYLVFIIKTVDGKSFRRFPRQNDLSLHQKLLGWRHNLRKSTSGESDSWHHHLVERIPSSLWIWTILYSMFFYTLYEISNQIQVSHKAASTLKKFENLELRVDIHKTFFDKFLKFL